MRRGAFVLFVVAALLFSACSSTSVVPATTDKGPASVVPAAGDSTFTIKVTSGTDPSAVVFSGDITAVVSKGPPTTKSVSGTTPKEYTVVGSIVTCTFQKAAEKGTLTVEMIKDGKVIQSSSTTESGGGVSLSSKSASSP